MANRHIIVVGASAGGVEALTRLCAGLPAGLPASVCVVQHLSPDAPSMLAALLDRAGPLPAGVPQEGEALAMGRIYVAPPDRHLLLRPGHLALRRGPFENRTRPAINALFRSAAVAYGPEVIGVVLTGLLDDGTDGLIAIKQAGGLSIVQDPAEAQWPSMPRQALERDSPDHVVKIAAMPALLQRLLAEPTGLARPLPADVVMEDHVAGLDLSANTKVPGPPGRPSSISCPDCGGVLNEIDGSGGGRFRCQIGHAFTNLGLAAAQNSELERALAVAVRTHRDRRRLFERLQEAAQARQFTLSATRWGVAAVEAQRLTEVLEQAMALLAPMRLPDAEDG